MKATAGWFKHDEDARYDVKLRSLKAMRGMAGIGMWWCLVEELRQQDGYKVCAEGNFCRAFASDCLTTPEDVLQFLDDCTSCGLLESEDGCYWSTGLYKRMVKRDEVNRLRAEYGKRGAENRWQTDGKTIANGWQTDGKTIANGWQTDGKTIANGWQDDSKTMASKSKSKSKSKSLEERITHPILDVPMNQTRYDSLIADYGQGLVDTYIQRAIDYVAQNGKRPYKDYAAVAANWIARDKVAKLKRPKSCPDCGQQYIGTVCHCGYEESL